MKETMSEREATEWERGEGEPRGGGEWQDRPGRGSKGGWLKAAQL